MRIETRESDDGAVVTIIVSGRFDIYLFNQFKASYEAFPKSTIFHIDLRYTEYMDSSALGMLLNMRSYLGGDCAKIKIVTSSTGIQKVLEIAKFSKKFSIESVSES
ncbi:STAS domain-containing protein [Hahella sp. CR1]|uniref:STAS domain-containing protein n=1 Tax=Hahella sp. CR1 TaxID=2992807 RepID=UPI002442FE9F|nr:STAS domain-containing protein [Hahella sp. CR1]MDG9670886.1 STAS domain-containing protein [Hahella sp. CR1]